MSAIVAAALGLVPKSPGLGNALGRVALPLASGLLTYLATYWFVGQAFQPDRSREPSESLACQAGKPDVMAALDPTLSRL